MKVAAWSDEPRATVTRNCGSRSRMPRPASASTAAEPVEQAGDGLRDLLDLAPHMGALLRSFASTLFARPAQPQFGDEIIGVAPIDRSG